MCKVTRLKVVAEVAFVLLVLTSLAYHSVLPITETNNVKMKNYNHWLKARLAIENLEEDKRIKGDHTPIPLVEVPGSLDVVYKSGTASPHHPGNVNFKDLLESHCESFYQAIDGASKKQAIVAEIVQAVEQKGGRFLEWSSDASCWMVMEDHVQIKVKVYNSLFYLHKQQNAKRNLQSNTSSTSIFEQQDGKRAKRIHGSGEKSCLGACM